MKMHMWFGTWKNDPANRMMQLSVSQLAESCVYAILLKIVCYKLVMKYVERIMVRGTIKIYGGGMKR